MTRRARLYAAVGAAVLTAGIASQFYAAGVAAGPAVASLGAPALLADEPFWSYPLCAVEDASSGPLPCLWPADKQGNGAGNTFYVTAGPDGSRCFHYVNPAADRRWGGCEAQ